MCIIDAGFTFFEHSQSHKHSSKKDSHFNELGPFLVWRKAEDGPDIICLSILYDRHLAFHVHLVSSYRYHWGWCLSVAITAVYHSVFTSGHGSLWLIQFFFFKFLAYTKWVYHELTGFVCNIKETFLLRTNQRQWECLTVPLKHMPTTWCHLQEWFTWIKPDSFKGTGWDNFAFMRCHPEVRK